MRIAPWLVAAPPSLLGQPKAVWRQPPLSGVLTPVRADGSCARSIDCGARAWQRGVKAALHRPPLEPSASLCGAGMRRRRVRGVSLTCLDGTEEVCAASTRPKLRLASRDEHWQRQAVFTRGYIHLKGVACAQGSSKGIALQFSRARRRAACNQGDTSSSPQGAKKTRPASTRRRGKDPIRPAEAPRDRGTK